MTFVRYRPEVEQVSADEQHTIDELGKIFATIQERVKNKEGVAKRGTHAKATGLLKGELIVEGDLPPELAQGLFARPERYEALIRFAQGPSEDVSDKASGQRGLSIKVLGVTGEHLPESPETTTQDWVLASSDPAFTDSTAETFLTTFRLGAAQATRLPQGAIIAGSRAARGVAAALETVGLGEPHLRFFGRAPTHPLGDSYYSQAPVRYGDYIAKVGAFPTRQTLVELGNRRLEVGDGDAFREAMVTSFARTGAEFEIRVQLCTDLGTMPVEDAKVEWPEEHSPYRTVARLVLPMQNAYSEERRLYVEERLAFNPAHALQAHRPLGSVNRVRMQVYRMTQDFRQQANGVTPAEPRTLAEVPD